MAGKPKAKSLSGRGSGRLKGSTGTHEWCTKTLKRWAYRKFGPYGAVETNRMLETNYAVVTMDEFDHCFRIEHPDAKRMAIEWMRTRPDYLPEFEKLGDREVEKMVIEMKKKLREQRKNSIQTGEISSPVSLKKLKRSRGVF